MKYYKVILDTDYCGTREEEYMYIAGVDLAQLDDVDEYVSDYVDEMAAQYADEYIHLAGGDMCEDDFETEDDFQEALNQALEDYYSGIYHDYIELSEEEVDNLKEVGIEWQKIVV